MDMLYSNTFETIPFDELTYFYSKDRQLQMISNFKHIYLKEMHIIILVNWITIPTRLQVG